MRHYKDKQRRKFLIGFMLSCFIILIPGGLVLAQTNNNKIAMPGLFILIIISILVSILFTKIGKKQ